MKKTLIAFIFLCIFYFIAGYIATRSGHLKQENYILFASIAGGVASVIGLLSLARPSISKTDIDALELESLKKVSEITEEIEVAKQRRSATEEEIERLATQKEEMEFLVRKASLSLFLKEQVRQHQEKIIGSIYNKKAKL